MDASFRSIHSSSEKVPSLAHGSPIAGSERASSPQPTSPEKLSVANVGANIKAGLRHKERKDRSREGLFRPRMNTAGRGSLSTYRERDNDDEGLLRPITRETTGSRWGSESTTIGIGSRRGSLFEGIDKDKHMGSIKRLEEIRSIDDLEQVRNQRKKGEEYLRSTLSLIGTLATDITRRLDYTYYGLLEKIAALNVTISSFHDLSESTSKLFDDFERETSSLEQDIRKQIGDLKGFQPQVERIAALEARMRAGKTRAGVLSNRVEAMRNEIERWEKREMKSQMRINQTLRIFWGIVAAAVFAVVAAAVIQNWPDEDLLDPLDPILPLNATGLENSSTRIYLPSDQIALPTTTATSGEMEATSQPTNHDPLRIFDEL